MPEAQAQVKVSIAELAAQPERFLDRFVEVTGQLVNGGRSYFDDLRPLLRDGQGHEIAVTPWLPLEVPAPRPGQPPESRPHVMSEFLAVDVALTGVWLRAERGCALRVDHAEITRPTLRRLTLEELITLGGIGGAGLYGAGVLTGELVSRNKKATLITAAKGTRSEVSFTTDLPERATRPLEGKRLWVAGVIRKNTPWVGTLLRAHIVHRPAEHHLPGDHLTLTGRLEERRALGPGSEAPPAGTWLLLATPMRVGRADVSEVFVQRRGLPEGEVARLHGRLDARHYGGLETPQQPYFALSGVSDVGAGEPRFDGLQFLAADTGAHLRVLVLEPREMFDAPSVILVVDPVGRHAYLGTSGGRVLGDNPFHGFTASAPIEDPTDADRAAVRFDDQGKAISAASGAPLREVARETPPPEVRDGLSTSIYFDVSTYAVYTFVSGGVAGIYRRLTAVIHLPHTEP